MKKSFIILSALVAALVVPVQTVIAASQISFISVTGNWHDAVDNVAGSQQGDPVIKNGVPTSSINWGVTSGPQSGYDFTRTIPGAQTLPPAPTPFFPLGTFTHRNFPISDPSLTAVQLDVVFLLSVDGVQTGPLKFTFLFKHEETPNNLSPCPYPTPAGEGCTDRVTFAAAPQPTTFNVGGVDYTLSMSFVDNNGKPVAEFITREDFVNTANLVGQFTLPPMTIPPPVLAVTKSGPATMNAGQWGNFAIDVQNTGPGDAWNASLRDLLPHGATGGMCNLTPEILSAQVFAADGVTPVPGKAPLNRGSDYSLSYSAAPNCQLDITMLTAAGMIGPNQRLIIRYRTQLDANSQNGVTLTNVAGAIQWFNGDSSNTSRKTYTGTLTNGTPGILDNQDAFTVTVALAGYVFEKTVTDLTSGANPATTAAAGDKLRYTLRFRTINQALSNFSIVDEMDALNAQADFAAGTLTLITSPAGADISATSSTGGAKGTGVLDIRNLNLPANGQIMIQFDITLKPAITNGTVVTNQATVGLSNGTTLAWSDDPNVNGSVPDPTVPNAEDPTRVTIAAAAAPEPALVLTKSGPPTMNLGQWGSFGIDLRNTGLGEAWNVSLRDQLPHGATGGMCNLTPEILSAQVFAADGVTPVPGKGALNRGSDYSLSYSAAPNCQLDITILTAAGTIGPNQRLIVFYRTQLDATTQSGITLTNIAGAVQWFNADSSNTSRKTYAGTLTNGTPGILDNQDAFTVTVPLSSYVFEKSVANLTSGANPATTAAPGDKLRYMLRIRASQALSSFRIFDEMDALNAQADFAAGTLTLVTSPAGADISATSGTGGTKGTGVIDIRNLDVPAGGQIMIQFDITLKTAITNGTVVTNQAALRLNDGTTLMLSDDPNVSGTTDPTRVTVVVPPPAPSFRVQKISTDLTGDPNVLLPGETLRYTITVKNVGNADAVNAMLRDAVPANTTYVAGSTTLNGAAVADVAGVSPLVNGMRINSPANATPGSMPADGSSNPTNVATITFDVVVNANVAGGTVISNQGFVSATGVADQPSDDPRTPAPNDPTLNTVSSPGAPLLVVRKSGPTTMSLGQWGNFAIDVQNTGLTDAWSASIRDLLPRVATGGMCDVMPEILSVQVFAADGVTPVSGKGALNAGSGFSLNYSAAPNCRLDLTMLTAAGSIGPNQHLIIRYRTQLDANTQNGVTLTNIAGAIQWFDADSSNGNRKSSTRTLTNGTPGTLDHEDAFTVTVALSGYIFEKTVADLTSGANPATTAAPGDRLRYTLRFRTSQALSNFRIVDELDALNAQADFVPGTLTLVASPVGADITATSNTGGTKGTGLIDIRNLNVAAGGEALIQFDITLKSSIAFDTIVSNQATLRLSGGTTLMLSDDPNVSGTADPTRVTIALVAAFRVQKISTDRTGDPNVLLPGDTLRYTITVKNISNADAANTMLRDAVPANTTYVANSTTLNGAAVADVAGVSPVVSGMRINSPANATPGLMPADASSNPANVATITFDVVVNANVAGGTAISNQGFVSATGIADHPSDDPRTPAPNDPTIDIVGNLTGPALVMTKSGPATINLGQWGNFAIDVRNTGASDAWNATLQDQLPRVATGGMCDLTPEILSAQVFAADGVTPVAGKGLLNRGSDYSLNYSAAPNCRLDITMLTAAGRIGPNERLIVRYRTQLDANTQNGITLTNIAGAIQWFDADSSNANRKASTRTLTNGTPGTVDHEDAFTVTVALSGYVFEKTVADLTSNVNPATTAAPGDRLRYTLRFRATSQALNNFRIADELDALNAQADFAPGTLTLVASPAGADISATSSTGGAKGTGVIDIRNLNVAAGGEVLVQFDITLKSPIAGGTVVTNQSTLRLSDGTTLMLSDDPSVSGTADPTRLTITSSSVFRVQKISTYLRDPNALLAGDTLRYTITVKNISNADAVNTVLRDAVPANTTYVAGSTTLNGAKVADAGGVSALVNGMPINSPANPTQGLMPADSSSNTANTATITFDVLVNPNTPDGTILSNQGFVSATGIVDQPSDDPRTPAPNDPTQDKVGNRPALYAEKRVVLFTDLRSPGIVDPGDVLRYTITIKNSAAIPATAVVLTDAVPANTTYVANSTLLNGSPFGQPDSGASPLAAGINIGTIAPGATAVLQYDLSVNAGTAAGTMISNQAVVNSAELPKLLTDGDGDPSNGPQPTVVVVGAGQQLSITNQVSVVGGGAAVPGAQLEYVLTVVNGATVPALNVVITDDLNASLPGQLAYVNQSATISNSAASVSFAGSTITANYSGPLAPGGVVVLKFRATLNPNLAVGTVVTNTGVVAWNNPTQTLSASVSIVVGSMPGLSVLNGSAWHDANFNDVQDSRERALDGWTVELYRDNQLWKSVLTDATGVYHIIGVDPNVATGVRYELRFRAPGAGANTAMLGRTVSQFTNGLQRITDIIVPSGANLQGLNLAIHPNGVIYNSAARTPIAGATLTLLDGRSTSPLPAGCFDDTAQQGQITLADGYYKFDLNFSGPACPAGGDYLIGVTSPPGSNYVPGYSQIIPPASSASTGAFSVPACPGSPADAIPSTTLYCEVQNSEFAPAASVPPQSAGTTYYVHLRLDGSQIPGSNQIFNNHIPLDPPLLGAITVTKTASLLNVSRGGLVPYTITANNHSGQLFTGVTIVDRMPAGFSYIKGSALIDGVPTEPSVIGLTLNWNGLTIAGTQTRTVKLLLAVGAGVTEGEFVNRAQVLLATDAGVAPQTRLARSVDVTGGKVVNRANASIAATDVALSTEATATVRLIPDVTFDCTDVTGKVFNDANLNGLQDDGEEGLPGVRVVTPRGLQAMTDQYGRYHITCAITPNEIRGSNFVLKLDDRTLPSGYRMLTDQVQIQRATPGKTLRVNFGASIYRVVAIDLSDAAFEPGTTEIRVQWKPRLDLLVEELRKAPAVLRLSYVADTEDPALVKRRVEAFKRQLTEARDAANHGSVLTIEPEVFWRRGAPPKQSNVRVPGTR